MVKLVVLYRKPEDPESFDKYYFGTHLEFAKKLPGVEKIEAAKSNPAPGGEDAPYYLIAEMWFSDLAALGAAMASPEGAALRNDTKNVAADDQITRLVCTVQ
jgi:uncharacterized protein (TIGR02118 family)